MPVMTRNMVDLQDEILIKIDEKFNDFKIAIKLKLENILSKRLQKL